MSITVSPFLRKVLLANALFSSVGAVIMAPGARFVAPLTELPNGLLVAAGIALVPFVMLVMFVARRQYVSRLFLVDIVAIDALWVAGSFGLLYSGYISPNALGVAFIAAQGLVVAGLTVLEFVQLRKAGSAASTA